MNFVFKSRTLSLNGRTLIMGIHNATPDSFSDGGKYQNIESALSHCIEMIDDGADIIDIGGESTRPGDTSILTIDEELQRVIPIIEALRKQRPDCVISIDTMKGEVAESAISAGSDIVNDVSGLKYSSKMATIAARTGSGLILMHMHGEPKSIIYNYHYNNLLSEVCAELNKIAQKAIDYGVRKESIIIDPGLGGGSFGKKKEQSLELLANVRKIKELGYPVMIGASRKGFIGDIINENDPLRRVYANLGAAAWAVANGVEIIRVHDVKETLQMIKVYETIKQYS